MKIEWIDSRRDPKHPPDPAYPSGKDIKLAAHGKHCKTDLPYPAKRCGVFVIECETCGVRVMVTTAGRPDDPRSIEILCKARP